MKYIAIALAFLFLCASPAEAKHHHRHHHKVHHVHRHTHRSHVLHFSRPVNRGVSQNVTYLPHPPGCPPTAFCGCGAALEVFGHNVRSLWLAANWFSFPRSTPAPGMVGVARHHVFVLREHIEGNIWMVADYNSGGHLSRLHLKDISPYTIVNPKYIKT